MTAAATALAGAAILVACGDDEGDGGTDPVIEVTDPGSEPRQLLLLAPDPQATTEATMRMVTQSDVTLDGQSLSSGEIPAVEIGVRLAMGVVTDEQIDATFEYGEVELQEGGDPAVAGAVGDMLDEIEGLTGVMSVTPSGRLIDSDISVPEDLDPTLANFATQMEEQFRSITVPFPEEPVGPGAM